MSAFDDGASLASSVARAAIAVKPSASLQLVEKLLEQAAQAQFKLRTVVYYKLSASTRRSRRAVVSRPCYNAFCSPSMMVRSLA
jgi:hypothetical protein